MNIKSSPFCARGVKNLWIRTTKAQASLCPPLVKYLYIIELSELNTNTNKFWDLRKEYKQRKKSVLHMKNNLNSVMGPLIWEAQEIMDSAKFKTKDITHKHYSNGEHISFLPSQGFVCAK